MEFTKRFHLFAWTKSWTLRQLNLLFRQEGSLLKTKGRQNKIMTSFKRDKASCYSECIMLGFFFFFQINLYLKCYISKKFHIFFDLIEGYTDFWESWGSYEKIAIPLYSHRNYISEKLPQIVVLSLTHVHLFCNPMDHSPSGSSVHGISQARILDWVAISFSRGSFWSKNWIFISCIGRQILYHWATWEAQIYCLTRFGILNANLLMCF